VNQITAPNGTSTADLIREEAGTGDHYVYQTVDTLVSGNEYVLSVYGRFLNRPWIALQTNDGAQAWFNLQTGVTGSFTGSRATITPVSGGWYRCALFYTASSNGAKNQHIHLSDADGNFNYTGVAGTGSYLWGAQFENGNLLGPYRKTEGSGFAVSGSNSMLDQMKFNLVNPVDSDAAFRLVYNGGWNPGYSGNKPNGVSGTYADTKLNVSSSLILNNAHVAAYSRTNISNAGAIFGAGTNNNNAIMLLPYLGGAAYINFSSDGGNNSISGQTNSLGLRILGRTNPNEIYLYNNTTKFIKIQASTGYDNITLTLGANNKTGVITNYDTREQAFSTIGDGLTDYEAKALYWIVQKFQTTLGRQVY
jgi:hypothetical protein